jgi:heme iron utilization protein
VEAKGHIKPPFDALGEAKRLMRLAREASLATLSPADAAPLVTLVGLANDYDGAPLLLLSKLSSHTKNIAADPRASLLLVSPRLRGDPLNRPRLTLTGELAAYREPSAKARYLARNPKAALYADFGDFAIYRLETAAVHFNGGFGRAAPLGPAEIRTDLAGADRLLRKESALLGALNRRGADFLARLATPGQSRRTHWRAIGLDPEGLDLAAGAAVARISFRLPARTPAAWLAAIDEIAGAPADHPARGRSARNQPPADGSAE